MNVYSGECEYGECGKETALIDNAGNNLRVGDIVMMSSRNSIGGHWHHGLSVVVENRPSLTGHAISPDFFVMGIACVDINTSEEWVVTRVKKWEYVLDGESWPEYGFNYRTSNPSHHAEPRLGGGSAPSGCSTSESDLKK